MASRDLDYEVVRTDRSGAGQIYVADAVMLAMVVSGEEDLEPEVNTKLQSLTRAPGDHLSLSHLADVARLQADFADVFSPLAGRTNIIQHHIETEQGLVVRSKPYYLPEYRKFWSPKWTARSGFVWIIAR